MSQWLIKGIIIESGFDLMVSVCWCVLVCANVCWPTIAPFIRRQSGTAKKPLPVKAVSVGGWDVGFGFGLYHVLLLMMTTGSRIE
jgi:hypothetical protein